VRLRESRPAGPARGTQDAPLSAAHSPAEAWARASERGSRLALRVMAFVAVTFGRRVARWVLHPITLYFVLFARGSRRHSRRYLERALGRPARARDLYRHVFTFAAMVLDRVYFARGRLHEFELRAEGMPLMDELIAQGRGALLLGAHLGSFEALHAIAPHFHLDIITIGRSHSTLAVRDWLDGGGLVGLLGDRVLGTEGPRTHFIELPFLGHPARFSDGPLRLAMLLRQRVVFMAALYRGGRCYDVHLEPLADFTQPSTDPAERDNRLREALQAYVQRLEAMCREAPYNWFNFFDFWNEDAA
jgi:predicted LPLAT superfamily acyltransferase